MFGHVRFELNVNHIQKPRKCWNANEPLEFHTNPRHLKEAHEELDRSNGYLRFVTLMCRRRRLQSPKRWRRGGGERRLNGPGVVKWSVANCGGTGLLGEASCAGRSALVENSHPPSALSLA